MRDALAAARRVLAGRGEHAQAAEDEATIAACRTGGGVAAGAQQPCLDHEVASAEVTGPDEEQKFDAYGEDGAARGRSFEGNQCALQRYILHCCQQSQGGLRDKPTKPRDYYHTCYCLSGLSVSQRAHQAAAYGAAEGEYKAPETHPIVVGNADNLLCATHPLFNIRPAKVRAASRAFGSLPATHAELMAMRSGTSAGEC